MSEKPDSNFFLRQGFKYFNRFMVFLWRLGLGGIINWGHPYSGRIMVLRHWGRKSGTRRETPVNYAIIGGDVYCTAGFGGSTDWYRNVVSSPQVEVWLPDEWWTGTAEDVSDSPDRLSLLRNVLKNSGFAAYAAGIDPEKMTDTQLDVATREYCLVRIRRGEARTGKGGPGELAWVWPIAVFAMLPFVMGNRRRRAKRR